MAKQVKARIRMQLPGGAATPAPPVGSMLGQQQVNIMDFCKQFNAKTADRKGQTVPVIVTVFIDKTFVFEIKTAPVSEMIKGKLKLAKGSSKPNSDKVGKLPAKDLEDIARAKMADLNTNDIEQAKKIVAGSARSMGVEIV